MTSGSERLCASGKGSASVTVQSLLSMLWSHRTWLLFQLLAACRHVLSDIALILIYRLHSCSWNGGGMQCLTSFPFSRISRRGLPLRLSGRWQADSCSPWLKIVFFSATCYEHRYQVETGTILTPSSLMVGPCFPSMRPFHRSGRKEICSRI